MSKRSIIATAFIGLVLVGASLPAAGQSDSVNRPIPEVTHNTWTSGAPLPTPVNAAAAAVLKKEIYLIGGGNESGAVADVQVYNPATNAWSSACPIQQPFQRRALQRSVMSYMSLAGSPEKP